MLNTVTIIIILIITGFLGTTIRYLLSKNIQGNILNGLLVSNVMGIIFAICFFKINPLLVTGFAGSLTTYSTFIKSSYKNYLFLAVHLSIYILISIILLNII